MEMNTNYLKVEILHRFLTYVSMVSLQHVKVAESLIYKLSSLRSNLTWQPHKFCVKTKIILAKFVS